jgi:nucleotide-binding universal stress UspA family protein
MEAYAVPERQVTGGPYALDPAPVLRSATLALNGDPADDAAIRFIRWLSAEQDVRLRIVSIGDAARATDADLVITGLPAARAGVRTHADALLRLVRNAKRPVLTVAAQMALPPRVCVAAIDFSRSSLHAARAALPLLAEDGTLFLAHVRPPLDRASEGLQTIYAQGIAGAFERVGQELRAGATGVRIEPVLLEGTTRAELERFASRVEADFVTLGTSLPDLARLRGGRLTGSLVRSGMSSLLVAPPPPKTATRAWDD